MAIHERTKQIALIIESSAAPRRRMLSGIARYIHEHQPWSLYLKPLGVERSLQRWLTDWRGDGIIANITASEADFFTNIGIPVVDLIGEVIQTGIALVHTNNDTVGRLGAQHLIERGFKNFAFIEYSGRKFSIARRDGFAETLAKHGATYKVHSMLFPMQGSGGPELWESQQQALSEWIEHLEKPCGVMCSTDLMGQQFLEACLRIGVNVPEQIAVVGVDNDEPMCQICCPPLSSVIINDEMRGYMAASVLDRLMCGGNAPEQPVLIEPAGVAGRASTDILAIDDAAVVAALRFIRDKACEGISVEDVARSARISRSVLERRFRKIVGRAINAEIVRVRLNRSIQLLSETKLEIKVIAYKAGFGSTSYMTTVFRKTLGRTPGSYRPTDLRRSAEPIVSDRSKIS